MYIHTLHVVCMYMHTVHVPHATCTHVCVHVHVVRTVLEINNYTHYITVHVVYVVHVCTHYVCMCT